MQQGIIRMGAMGNSFNMKYIEKENIVIHILITLFGISAWIGINGIYVQLPVLVNISPEGWSLPAYIVLIVQSANVGPLLYTLLQYFQCKVNEPLCILCLLTLGTFAMALLIFFYYERTAINGNQYSLALFALTFFNALIGCFSSVLFMPYLRTFNKVYLVSYFVGEGLSGVLPSIVALIQGIDENAKCRTSANGTIDSSTSGLMFSPSHYFLFIFFVLLLCLIAFIALEYSSFVRKTKNLCERRHVTFDQTEGNYRCQNEFKITSADIYGESVCGTENCTSQKENAKGEKTFHQQNVVCLSVQARNYLFLLLGVCCFFSNGFFPSIQSYSCIPYGNIAYKLSITFAQFANPLACCLALWFVTSKVKVMNYLFGVCLIIGSYVTYLALMSPTPPLQNSTFGVVLVVASWTVLIGFISYLKLLIVSVFRSVPATKMLFIAGLIMQMGSASGAIISFLIINFTNSFKAYDNCIPENS